MYAVVRAAGKQYKASLGDILSLEKIDGNPGDKIDLEVLISGDATKSELGGKIKVTAEIIEFVKGDKVIAFKKRRRHNSRRKRGHRQNHTTVQIVQMGTETLAADKKAKPLPLKPAQVAEQAKKSGVKADKPAAKPKETSEKAAPKKAAAKPKKETK